MSEDTVFDAILRKDIPADIVYEDDSILAFRDINPVAPVHVVVVPKYRFTSLIDAPNVPDEVLASFVKGISKVASVLGLEAGGYRCVFNSGRDAQQSVAYVHAHIIGGRSLEWPPG